MSLNKNTVDCSHIDSIIQTLQSLGKPYSLTIMKEVKGYGLDDNYDSLCHLRRLEYNRFVLLDLISKMHHLTGTLRSDELDNEGVEKDKLYPLRRLEYDHFVILERIERTSKCDIADIICSYPFDITDEPLDWQYEIMEVTS